MLTTVYEIADRAQLINFNTNTNVPGEIRFDAIDKALNRIKTERNKESKADAAIILANLTELLTNI